MRQGYSLGSTWTLCFLCHFYQCKESTQHMDAISIRGTSWCAVGPCSQTPFPHFWHWPMDSPTLNQWTICHSPNKGSVSGIQELPPLCLYTFTSYHWDDNVLFLEKPPSFGRFKSPYVPVQVPKILFALGFLLTRRGERVCRYALFSAQPVCRAHRWEECQLCSVKTSVG